MIFHRFPQLFFILFGLASSTTISSGLKAQTWSPWSPHHQTIYRDQIKASNSTSNSSFSINNSASNLSNSSSSNWTTPIQPTRRASTTSSRSDDESYVFRLAKKRFIKTNTFSNGLSNIMNADRNESIAKPFIRKSSFNAELTPMEKSNSLENVSTRSNPF